ncbi:MAG TPA: hypothetical protein DCF65_10850 [Chloroflexi bacterium]|nr:hypothetical protein [Chloroflexota bacterium]HAF19663.1 hypothetical protein [Chloroflexota bacterium]
MTLRRTGCGLGSRSRLPCFFSDGDLRHERPRAAHSGPHLSRTRGPTQRGRSRPRPRRRPSARGGPRRLPSRRRDRPAHTGSRPDRHEGTKIVPGRCGQFAIAGLRRNRAAS